jgi:hypothetical protein
LESYFGSGSVYSKADALPSALEQIVISTKNSQTQRRILFTNKEASTKEEPIAPRVGLTTALQSTTSIRQKSCDFWLVGQC